MYAFDLPSIFVHNSPIPHFDRLQSSTEAALQTAHAQGLPVDASIFFGGHSLGSVMVSSFVANMTEWAPKGMMLTGGFLGRYVCQ